MQYIISLDIGTSSMRAVLYGTDGSCAASFRYEYHPQFPKENHVEQDPFSWLRAARSILSAVGNCIRERHLSVDAVAVTSQRSSLIPVDHAGDPLSPAIMWQDKRTLGECETLKREYGLFPLYRKTGLRINPYFVLPKLMWLRSNLPEIYRGASKFIGVQDFVVYYLTGKFVTDWTQAGRTMLMNIETFRWDPALLRIAAADLDHLPQLTAPGSIAGGITRRASEETGISEGTPVVLCGGDQQNAAVGIGVVMPGLAEANTGT